MGYGRHPGSGYMVSDSLEVFALSSLDVIIDIAGMFFRCRSMSHAKNMNVTEEHGMGSLDPFALVNHDQTYSGSLSFASFLVDGTPAMTNNERLILQRTLLDQKDEGRSKYFHIYTMEVPGRDVTDPDYSADDQLVAGIEARASGNESGGMTGLNFIEALLNCKVTKLNRDYAEKSTIVSSVDFKYMYGIPA